VDLRLNSHFFFLLCKSIPSFLKMVSKLAQGSNENTGLSQFADGFFEPSSLNISNLEPIIVGSIAVPIAIS
jgi:hypothetical protein